MITETTLNSWLGKSMADICLNGYDTQTHNHCAHFVAHTANLRFGYTCLRHAGGQNAGANLRVHEVFAQCPIKHEILQTTPDLSGLVFVSASGNFETNAGTTTLRNIPRKHIGFIHNAMVWHYSNPRNRVIKQAMSEFLFHYRGQQNSMWFGSLPPTARLISFGQC